jgi:hypothetical protein
MRIGILPLVIWGLIAGSIFAWGRSAAANNGGRMSPTADAARPKSATPLLTWVDEPTGETLFTSEDLVRFDWERQLFEMKRDRAMDFETWADGNIGLDRKFVVRDKQGVIYRGTFVQAITSGIYAGPVILLVNLEKKPPLYQIDQGYPETPGEERFAPRLQAALAQAGLLGAIDEGHRVPPLMRVGAAGSDGKQGLGFKAYYYLETFRPGEKARVSLVVQQKSGALKADSLEVKLETFDRDKHPLLKTTLSGLPFAGRERQSFSVRFDPWDRAGKLLKAAEQGDPISITLTLAAKKKTKTGMRAAGQWELTIPGFILPKPGKH